MASNSLCNQDWLRTDYPGSTSHSLGNTIGHFHYGYILLSGWKKIGGLFLGTGQICGYLIWKEWNGDYFSSGVGGAVADWSDSFNSREEWCISSSHSGNTTVSFSCFCMLKISLVLWLLFFVCLFALFVFVTKWNFPREGTFKKKNHTL